MSKSEKVEIVGLDTENGELLVWIKAHTGKRLYVPYNYASKEMYRKGYGDGVKSQIAEKEITKQELITILKAIKEFTNGFEVISEYLIEEKERRSERWSTWDLESYIDNYYEDIVYEIKKQCATQQSNKAAGQRGR